MSETTQVTDQGWARIWDLSRKAHYYDAEGRSLCRNFGSFGVPADAFGPETTYRSPHDCAACRRRLDKRGVK